MRLLLLTNYFPPEIGTGPHMIHELGESLAKFGHDVTVVTGFPRYNLPEMPEKYRGRLFYREKMQGMDVLRINALNFYGRSVLSRGLVQLLAPPMLGMRAMLAAKPDLVYAVSPPLLMGVIALLTAARFRVPCVVNVQDLFPQHMIDLGVLKNRVAIKIFEILERFVYRSAAAITVMSDGNRQFVVDRGAAPQKVRTIFNWTDTDAIQSGERMNDFRREHDLGDRFVVVFAGAMGVSQGLEVVIEAAKELINESNLLFLMIGDGVAREGLKRDAAGLHNVRFLPMQPKEKYPLILAASDACLVTLKPQVLTPSVPSKIGTIMAAGRPIIASLPLHGDAPRFIIEADGGLVVKPGDSHALAQAVLTLKNEPDKARRMGASGRRYAEERFSRTVWTGRVEKLFQCVLERKAIETWESAAKKKCLSVGVRHAQPADLEAIVKIHLAAFHRGFNLSALGPKFLRKYYELIMRFPQGILLAAEDKGKIAGFAAGFVNPRQFYATLMKNKWSLIFAAMRSFSTAPWVIKRIFRVIRRGLSFMSRPETQNELFCELSSVAVDPLSAGQGVGKALVREFANRARERNAVKLYLTTDAVNNDAINAFYRGLGFRLADTFKTPEGRLLNEFDMPLNHAVPE